MPLVILVLLVLAVVLVAAAQLAPPAARPLSWLAIGLSILALLLQVLGPRI